MIFMLQREKLKSDRFCLLTKLTQRTNMGVSHLEWYMAYSRESDRS